MQCDNCGKTLPDSASFCTSCGWKTENWTKSAKKSRSICNSAILAVIIGILSLVLLCILVFIHF